MYDEGYQSLIPSRAPQVQPAIQRVETGLLDGRCVPDVMKPNATINIGRSSADTVTAS